jgi:hypothetical protein
MKLRKRCSIDFGTNTDNMKKDERRRAMETTTEEYRIKIGKMQAQKHPENCNVQAQKHSENCDVQAQKHSENCNVQAQTHSENCNV